MTTPSISSGHCAHTVHVLPCTQFHLLNWMTLKENLKCHRPKLSSILWATDFVQPCNFMVNVDNSIWRTAVWVLAHRPLIMLHTSQSPDISHITPSLWTWHVSQGAHWRTSNLAAEPCTFKSCCNVWSTVNPQIAVRFADSFTVRCLSSPRPFQLQPQKGKWQTAPYNVGHFQTRSHLATLDTTRQGNTMLLHVALHGTPLYFYYERTTIFIHKSCSIVQTPILEWDCQRQDANHFISCHIFGQ
jgi:hypothetical protein